MDGFETLGNMDKFSGVPSEFKMKDMYHAHTGGKDIPEDTWAFISAFTHFKMAGICQGVYARSLMGSASSTKGGKFLKVAKFTAALAARLSKQDYPYRLRPVEYSFLTYTDKFRETRAKLCYFMDRWVFDNERTYYKQVKTGAERWKYVPPIIEELKEKAKAQGLWNLFLPSVSGFTQLEYA